MKIFFKILLAFFLFLSLFLQEKKGVIKYNNNIEKKDEGVKYELFLIGNDKFKVDFLTINLHKDIFVPKINLENLSKKYGKYKEFHIFAAAFTPDWKKIEDVSMENGILLKTFEKNHGGIVSLKNKNKLEIIKKDDIKNFELFFKTNTIEKNSLFGQKILFFNGKNTFDKKNNLNEKKIIYRFLFQTENFSGLIFFEEKYFLKDILSFFESEKINNESIKNLIYLDVGSVSKSFHCKKNKCEEKKDDTFRVKMDGYTNVLIFYK